jgi:hypothetical protein
MSDEQVLTPAQRTWAALAAGLGAVAWAATAWTIVSGLLATQRRVELYPIAAAWAAGLSLLALSQTCRNWRQTLLTGVLVAGWLLPLILDSVCRSRPDAFGPGAAFVQGVALQTLPLLLLTFWFQWYAWESEDESLVFLPRLHARLAAVGLVVLLAPTVWRLSAGGVWGAEGLFGWMTVVPVTPWKHWIWSGWKLAGTGIYAACLIFPLLALTRFARCFWQARDERDVKHLPRAK